MLNELKINFINIDINILEDINKIIVEVEVKVVVIVSIAEEKIIIIINLIIDIALNLEKSLLQEINVLYVGNMAIGHLSVKKAMELV